MKNRKDIFGRYRKKIKKNFNVIKYPRIVKAVRSWKRITNDFKWKSIGNRAVQIARAILLVSKRISLATKLSYPKN